MTEEIPKYKRKLWARKLKELFDGVDREEVLSWLLEGGDRDRVIIVGAGFTRNAKSHASKEIPLWSHLTTAMARHLRVPENASDALELADLFVEQHGRDALERWLEPQLDDEALEAAEAHTALWESQPAAVVTTNFLDTVLERSATSLGVPLFDCTHLARPRSPAQRPLLYIHGHRSAPRTWVVSRRDYEDLGASRPMLQIKFRQLLAEYPALIVGYSLTDPDFHLLYRETARLLRGEHPPALVVLPASKDRSSEQSRLMALRRDYWRSIRVRIVQFSAQQNPGRAYRDFFRLTERPRSRVALEYAFDEAREPRNTTRDLDENLEVAVSIVQDLEALPYLRHDTDWVWRRALEAVLTDEERREARQRAEHSLDFRKRSPESAVSADGPSDSAVGDVPDEGLRLSDWIPSEPTSLANALFSLLRRHESDDEVRSVEIALQRGAPPELLVRWLEAQLTADDGAVRSQSAVRMLAVLRSADPVTIALCLRLAEEMNDTELLNILGEQASLPDAEDRIVTELVHARECRMNGDIDRAVELYQGVLDELGPRPVRDEVHALSAYFAARGVRDLTPWDAPKDVRDFRERQYLRLEKTAAAVAWQKRAENAQRGAARSGAGRNGSTVRESGYENRGFGFSTSPGRLWAEYEWAKKRGAPVSLLLPLLLPLLGTFPTSADELEVRLAYNLDKPGEWLSTELEERRFSVHPSRPFLPESPSPQRGEIVRSVNEHLFSNPRAAKGLRRSAGRSILAAYAEILEDKRLDACLELLTEGPTDDGDGFGPKAWLGLSRCFSWERLRDPLIEFVRGASEIETDGHLRFPFRERNLVHRLPQFPWEHWTYCDAFLGSGGAELLEALLTLETPSPEYVGWALRSLLALSPTNEAVRAFATRWLLRFSLEEAQPGETNAALGILSELSSIPPELSTIHAHVLSALKNPGTLDPWLIGVGSQVESEIARMSREHLSGWYDRGRFLSVDPRLSMRAVSTQEFHGIAWVAHQRRQRLSSIAEEHILTVLDTTWRPLPALAPILHPSYWTESGWRKVRSMVARGRRDSRYRDEWKYRRLQLLAELLSSRSKSSDAEMDNDLLHTLQDAAFEAIHCGDWQQANRAVYLLPELGASIDTEEVESLCEALRSAAADSRIEVAHGAAYTAAFVTHSKRKFPMAFIDTAAKIDEAMRVDPCAILLRQRQYGIVMGSRESSPSEPVSISLTKAHEL